MIRILKNEKCDLNFRKIFKIFIQVYAKHILSINRPIDVKFNIVNKENRKQDLNPSFKSDNLLYN